MQFFAFLLKIANYELVCAFLALKTTNENVKKTLSQLETQRYLPHFHKTRNCCESGMPPSN